MSKRNILIIVSCIVLAITAVRILPAIYTTKDTISDTTAPKEYFIDISDDPVAPQNDRQNAAYAADFVLRYCGDHTKESDLSPDIGSFFGTVMPSHIVHFFRQEGYQTKAYHGDLSTLKIRLNEGVPIIVCIRDGKHTHYAVLVGYDADRLYLADPNTDNVYDAEGSYNRVVENEEFRNIWKSDFLISDQVYIVAKKNAEP